MSRRLALLAVPLFALSLPAAAPPTPSPTAHGDRLRDAYFRHQAKRLADDDVLAGIRSRAEWDKLRPRWRREFLDMMGLWPLPERTPLKATVVGRIDQPTYTVEKLHYQSWPGLYVSANLYLPKKRSGPVPAVLYVCGHGPTVIAGVPYGNKVTYQHHAIWFAENGYACLVVDTLQLGELPGLHHGTHRFGMWWWAALGYTPAGIELWNALRGIDYLVSRPEVDGKRLGVTGRSGGGATSWWVGAADERVGCIIPVAGIADLLAHVSEGYPGRLADGVVAGHCDCMYMVNTHRWDYTRVIALCAPRALMLGNSDKDEIFPIPGYRRMTDKVRRLYETLGAGERFALLETQGPHKDTPALRDGAFRWMNRWLKGDPSPVDDPERPRLKPQQLKVFDRAPADAVNAVVHERFRQATKHELPATEEAARAWRTTRAPALKQALRERCFGGWPQKAPALAVRTAGTTTHGGVRVQAFDFLSEEQVPLRLWLVSSTEKRPETLTASVLDEEGWQRWLADLGPAFRGVLHDGGNPAPVPYPVAEPARLSRLRDGMERQGRAYALITPRGVGRTRWSSLSRHDNRTSVEQHIRRRFYLLGQTLEGQQVWDVRRAVACLSRLPCGKETRLVLQGNGEMAAIALYAALFEPSVVALELHHLPTSHRQGPTFLNVLTVLDLPQAVALALPRRVRITATGHDRAAAWDWPLRVQQLLGHDGLVVDRLPDAKK